MKFISQLNKLKPLYNFFLFLALINIFFHRNSHAKTFLVNDIEISSPFEINFNKNEIMIRGLISRLMN